MPMTMNMPKDFAADPTLSPAVAAIMQAAYNRRLAAGLVGSDGSAHVTQEAKALYDAGVSPFSREYTSACYPKKVK
jgi:hypothetical protein